MAPQCSWGSQQETKVLRGRDLDYGSEEQYAMPWSSSLWKKIPRVGGIWAILVLDQGYQPSGGTWGSPRMTTHLQTIDISSLGESQCLGA